MPCVVIDMEPKRTAPILARMGAETSGSSGAAWFADGQAFAELAARQEVLGGLLAHVQDGLSVADPRGKCVLVNRALCEMTGFSAAELLATPPHPYWPPEEEQAIGRALARSEHGVASAAEVSLLRKNGEHFPALLRPTWITDERGQTLASLSSITDLSTARQAEATLKASEQRWRSIAENPFDFVIIIGRDYKYRFINHVEEGLRVEDVIGVASAFDFMPPEDRPRVRHLYDEAFRTGRPASYESYVPQVDRWYANVVGAIQSDGEIRELSILSREITETKRAERSQRRSERRLALALAGVQDGLVEVDLRTGDHVYSTRTYDLLGFVDGDPALSTQVDGLLARVHPEDLKLVAPALRTAMDSGAGFDQEFRLQARDGSYRWFHARGRNVEDEEKRFFAFLTDITQRYEAEEQRRALAAELQQAQRLETIGTLAGGIAHDFNNLLTPILGAIEFAQLTLPEGHDSREVLEDALCAAQRAKSLTEQILTFARPGHAHLEPVDLIRIVTEELRLQPETAAVQLVTEFAQDHPTVLGDGSELQQIVANLLANALHAMRGRKGVLRLRVDRVQSARLGEGADQLPPGDYVRLTVSDQGIGMTESVQRRALEPFFTTKPAGQGTGLGLAVVHGVIKRHRGHLRLRSEAEKGTTFEVFLPAWRAASERVSGPPTEVPATHPIGRAVTGEVACVDDEPAVLRVMTRALTRAGLRVRATTSPREALEWFRATPSCFDVLVTDLRMPELSGLELTQRVRALRSDLPVILVTAHAEGIPQVGALPGFHAVVYKPFRSSELVRVVRDCLASRADLGARAAM